MDSRSADTDLAALLPRSYAPLGSKLAQAIGRPACEWTIDDLLTYVRNHGVRLVSLVHVGGDGWLKALDFAPRDAAHLRDILAGGERADGSSLFPGLGITAGASDVMLRPRIDTAYVDPFAPVPTLAVLCGHAARDGAPLPQSPDTIVRRAHERLTAATGVTWHALGEIEFFLGRPATRDDAYGATERGYHATAPFVFGEPLRRRALAALADMGVPVKYAHAEVGWIAPSETDGVTWEQHEIELGLDALPAAADAVVLTQWVLRNLAREHGVLCSFEPVIRRGHAGTGMHFHFSPAAGGRHLDVREPGGGLTAPARLLIGGLVTHGGALMAFGNRVPGSFVRTGQAKEAPDTIRWGDFDRSALVRLPVVARDADGRAVSAPTIEFRLPDGSAHPHLLLAGIAQATCAAVDARDIDTRLAATAAHGGAGNGHGTARVPTSFATVAEALAAQRAMFEAGGVFPAAMIDAVLAKLEAEPTPAA